MKGRTEENIKNSISRMHKIAEIIFDQELELIPSYISGRAPDTTNRRVWYLGESIKMMADADYFIGIDCTDVFEGCNIERDVAVTYGIPNAVINACSMMPDIDVIMNAYYNDVTEEAETK
jgi:hypothetical protein